LKLRLRNKKKKENDRRKLYQHCLTLIDAKYARADKKNI